MTKYVGKTYKVTNPKDDFLGVEFTATEIVDGGRLLECVPIDAETERRIGIKYFRAYPSWIVASCVELTQEAINTPDVPICACDIVQMWNKGHDLNCVER